MKTQGNIGNAWTGLILDRLEWSKQAGLDCCGQAGLDWSGLD